MKKTRVSYVREKEENLYHDKISMNKYDIPMTE